MPRAVDITHTEICAYENTICLDSLGEAATVQHVSSEAHFVRKSIHKNSHVTVCT